MGLESGLLPFKLMMTAGLVLEGGEKGALRVIPWRSGPTWFPLYDNERLIASAMFNDSPPCGADALKHPPI